MSPFSKVKMSPFVVTRGDENAEEDNYDESKRVKPLRGYAKNRIKSFIVMSRNNCGRKSSFISRYLRD